MKLLLLAFAVTAGYSVQAATDFNCLRQCTAAGSQYGFCQSRCEYNGMPSFPALGHNPDPACMRSCQGANMSYGYCQQRCAN